MSKLRILLIGLAIAFSIASIVVAGLEAASPETNIIFLGIGLLLLSTAALSNK